MTVWDFMNIIKKKKKPTVCCPANMGEVMGEK